MRIFFFRRGNSSMGLGLRSTSRKADDSSAQDESMDESLDAAN